MKKAFLLALFSFVAFVSAQAACPADSVCIKPNQAITTNYFTVIAAPGQTLFGLSGAYGVPVEVIRQANIGILVQGDILTVGMQLRIPVRPPASLVRVNVAPQFVNAYTQYYPVINQAALRNCGGRFYHGFDIVAYTGAIATLESGFGTGTGQILTGCGVKIYPQARLHDPLDQIDCTTRTLCTGLDGGSTATRNVYGSCPVQGDAMSCVLSGYAPVSDGNSADYPSRAAALAASYSKVA
ncbi:MAG TPA: LysM peptidoglycan-binding domain-containing protein [Candidatus Norongarragalinales archaeon]|jgi:hypothetical protein|nr:LysM peptidoglycan-binding domain-containing protein [Candidatus Norongarragalinales archaeon]